MEVSTQKVLKKMEDLLLKAKSAPSFEKQQAYVLAIKALCELIAEDEQLAERPTVPLRQPDIDRQPIRQMPTTETVISKPMSLEDANGSSLLDF
ncbi:YwdI family protein [Bacillus testis]|uniref:YwdI family protein n=1 Tax=Bacillus testis TaxID=1622072 RepID=UPI00067F543A|nr:YwdI family protein [Bacillus testis]